MIVTKSSGITEQFDESKIFIVVKNACAGTTIDPHSLMAPILRVISDGMTTADIQRTVVKLASDRITKETPDYQLVAARLEMYGLRKRVYGQFEVPDLYSHVVRLVGLGIYDKELLSKWTKSDYEYFDTMIDHELDMKLYYAAVMQFKEKYLVKDRSTDTIYETPQVLYMLVAMCLHQEETHDRLQKVVDFYNVTSLGKLSLPTPILAGVRTPTRQFSSCVTIESGDDLDSINATSAAIVKYISKRAGIGIGGGAIRAEGSRIRSGEVKHTGIIPFWKHFQTAVKSCSQGGIRGGAATIHYPMWHLEVEKILVLKNNKGVEENRIRQLDYSIQINKLMFERLRDNDYITLFSPDVDGGRLYETYFTDPDEFKRRYVELESDISIRKKRIKAADLFSSMMHERGSTGRIYIQFIDNVNQFGPYDCKIDPIKMSNLCQEIALPTRPVGKPNALISLCTLAAYNLGAIDGLEDFLFVARCAVRALDNLLDYQDYPVDAALDAKNQRSLGLGITNFAYFLAKNYVKYSDGSANKLVHELMEMIQYCNLVASNELAKERGENKWHHRNRYSKGLLPIDWYNKNIDELVPNVLKMDWETLRTNIKTYGLRNDTLSALMPCESSSQITNSTNGIEPPRQLLSVKQSKDGVFNQLVPDVSMLDEEYETAWVMARKGMIGYYNLVAIMQKFTDQSISANGYYDPAMYANNKIPMEDLLLHIAHCSFYGVKNLYYHNVNDGADGTEDQAEDCSGCKV